MDTDILKPDTGSLTIERPLQTSSKGTSELSTGRESSGDATPEHGRVVYAEPVSEGEEDEDMDMAPGVFIVQSCAPRAYARCSERRA